MNACHEPISWLRLEHYHISELPPDAHCQVQAHLDDCPHCRGMLAEIQDDARTLPPLPLPDASPAQPWYRRLSILSPAVARPVLVATLALFLVLPPSSNPDLPGPAWRTRVASWPSAWCETAPASSALAPRPTRMAIVSRCWSPPLPASTPGTWWCGTAGARDLRPERPALRARRRLPRLRR